MRSCDDCWKWSVKNKIIIESSKEYFNYAEELTNMCKFLNGSEDIKLPKISDSNNFLKNY